MSIDSNYYESSSSFISAYSNRGKSDADFLFNVRSNTSKGALIYINDYKNYSDNYEVKVAIKNNHFSHGMNFDRSDRIEIKNNHFGGSISLNQLKQVLISGNNLIMSQNDNWQYHGIYQNGVTRSEIKNNQITGYSFRSTGISLNQSNATVSDNVISKFGTGINVSTDFTNPTFDSLLRNTVVFNGNRGIQVSNYGRVLAQYNNIYDNYDTASYNESSSQYFQTYDFYAAGEAYDEIDARFNYWGETVKSQMATGANPKNINRIYDKKDDAKKSFVNYAQWRDCKTCTISTINQSGTLSLVNSSDAAVLTYAAGSSLRVKLIDSDRNQDASAVDVVTVSLTSETETTAESLVLTESGDNTGIFYGTYSFNVSSTASNSNSLLDVQKGDKLEVSYTDPSDDFGNSTLIKASSYYDVTLLSGTLATNMTKANSPYLLTGDVTIPTNYDLDIEAGVEIRFTPLSDDQSSGNDKNRVEIIVNGGLDVLGTASDTVRFLSNGESPASGDWYGIRYQSYPAGNVSYARFDHASQVIQYQNVSYNNSDKYSDTLKVRHNKIVNSGSGISIFL